MSVWEIERKYRLPSIDLVVELLQALRRARYHEEGPELQRDEYYDTHDGELGRMDYTVRLRVSGDGECMVALKGPRAVTGGTYSRIELEFSGLNPSQNRLELQRRGLQAHVIIEKRRTSFVGQHVIIALDEVAQLGWFCEVEGTTDDAIDLAVARLGLLGLEEITQNYTELLRIRRGQPQGDLVATFTG